MSDQDTQLDPEDAEEDGAVVDTTVETTLEADGERDKAFAEQRRKARAAERKAKELEKKLADLERKEAEAEGRWQELAQQERQAREDLERKIAERDQQEQVTEVASRLRFRNPQLAHRLLTDEDRGDAQLAEAALKRLAKQEPYLIADPPERTGTTVSGVAANGEKDPYAAAGSFVIDMIEATRGGRTP